MDAIAAICLSQPGKKAVENCWMDYKELKVNPVPIGVSNTGVALETINSWKRAYKASGLKE
jgi:hypothetical protein